MTEYVDTVTGQPVKYLNSANGGAVVSTKKGTGQLTKNRNRSALATAYAEVTNTVTFTSTDNVTHIEFVAKSNTAAEAVQADSVILVLYDATNEAIATGFFADAGAMTTDVAYEIVPANQVIVRDFASYLSRIDFLPLNDAMRVGVLAQ